MAGGARIAGGQGAGDETELTGAHSMAVGSVVVSPCAECARETRHDVVHVIASQQEGSGYSVQNTFATLQCRGCETVSLQHISDDGEFENVKNYPTLPLLRRSAPSSLLLFRLFPPNSDIPVAELLDEIYSAARSGLRRLTTLGLRALLEQLIISKVGDHRSFKGNLERFTESGYTSINQRDALDAVYEVGSAAMHRGFNPSMSEIELMLDAVEKVLGGIYGIRPEIISSNVPPKRRRPSPTD
jgi:hypothetical protein